MKPNTADDAPEPRTVKVLTDRIHELTRIQESTAAAREIGECLDELQPQIPGGASGWAAYLRKHFDYSVARAQRHIAFYRKELRDQRKYERLAHAGVGGNKNYSKTYEAIKPQLRQFDAEARRNIAQLDQRAAQRKLGHQLIDIGYRALAVKCHPDKGGSDAMMANLTAVRDRLRRCLG